MAFVFATCRPGLEGALKDAASPGLRLAFSRPGLVTFKHDGAFDGRPSPWAHVWGESLGRASSADEVLALAPPQARRLHVFARDGSPTDELEATLRATGRFDPDARAAAGDRVLDVIVAADEPFLCGLHTHSPHRSPFPGGDWRITVPPESPSRAYAKIEEAIAWAELPFAADQIAVEIGSAPGGAAYALSRRGLQVWGVDTADMVAIDRVHHVRETLASVRWEALPKAVDWLLCDVNLAPPVAIHGLARLVPAWKRTLRAAIITLKMNDAAMRSGLATWLDRIRAMGFTSVDVSHLPSNRHELCAVARR